MIRELKALRDDMEDTDCCLDSFEYLLRGRMVESIKEVGSKKRENGVDERSQTPPQPAPRSTPDTRKWLRESTASPEETKTKKPAEKRLKALKHLEEWVEVPAKRDIRKKRKNKLQGKTSVQSRPVRSVAILVKPLRGLAARRF